MKIHKLNKIEKFLLCLITLIISFNVGFKLTERSIKINSRLESFQLNFSKGWQPQK